MTVIKSDYSHYIHTYEAYRVPKGTTVKNAADEDIVLSKDKDQLVLTAAAGKQLVQDRMDFGDALHTKAELAAEKTQEEAQKKFLRDQMKAIEVFRSMSHGDIVPHIDESRLMNFDPKLYQAAKMAQTLAQMAEEEAEKKKSEWDEKEEKEYAEKLEKLNKEAHDIAWGIQGEFDEFSAKQMSNIVEVDASGVDFSNFKTIGLGGVVGEFIDLSL